MAKSTYLYSPCHRLTTPLLSIAAILILAGPRVCDSQQRPTTSPRPNHTQTPRRANLPCHGGGVGIGRSLHAGQVSVADGTDLAAEKLERLLTNDPGMGVIRHVDAGYDRAIEVANERGVRIPMNEN
jgi:hypothetical protein